MKVQLLGSSVRNAAQNQYVGSFIVNGTVAIDAGSLGFHGTPQEQEAIRHVFLTHLSLRPHSQPADLIENVWTPRGESAGLWKSGDAGQRATPHL